MNGLALTILVGQLPKLFGFSIDADGLIDEARGVRRRRRVGRGGRRRRSRSALVSLGADPRAPALAAAGPGRAGRGRRRDRRGGARSTSPTTASRSSGRCRRASRRSRCPSPVSDLPLLRGGRARASRSSRSPTRSRPRRRSPRARGQEVDGNGEMIGIGAANLAAGLFQGFPVSTSGSRTAVAEQAGRQDAADRASSAPRRSC